LGKEKRMRGKEKEKRKKKRKTFPLSLIDEIISPPKKERVKRGMKKVSSFPI